MKTRENELHEPKVVRDTANYLCDGYVEHHYIITVKCAVCGRGLSGNDIVDTSAEKRECTDKFVLAQIPNFCPHCGARLKEIEI